MSEIRDLARDLAGCCCCYVVLEADIDEFQALLERVIEQLKPLRVLHYQIDVTGMGERCHAAYLQAQAGKWWR